VSELFPELDDPTDDAPGTTEVWHPSSARGLAALRHILNLRELLPGTELSRAEFALHESTLRLVLTGDAMLPIHLSIAPRSTRPAALRTRQLNLSYETRDGARPAPFVAQVLQRLQHRLTHCPFELLLRAATLGATRRDAPGAKPAADSDEAPPSKALPTEHRGSVAFSYRPPNGWRNFFEQKEMHRGLFHGLRGPITVVHHADIECHASDAPRFDGSVNFLNFPRQEPWPRPADGPDARLQDGSRFLLTDMDDRDVIKGADTRLEHLLAAVGTPCDPGTEAPSTNGASSGVVFVVPTCISLVTGDDIDAAANRRGVRRRMPILNVGNQNDPFAAMFHLVSQEPGFRDRARRPHRVNLVGLPFFTGRNALLELLRDGGVEPGCELLPAFDLAQARDYCTASVQVLYPSDQAREVYQRTLSALPLETIAPPAPFGIEGTRHWIESIGASVGLEASCSAAFDRAFTKLHTRWEALRARARDVTLGFVVDDAGAEVLRDPTRTLGVPLVRMLIEMGFSLLALRHEAHGRTVSPLEGFETIPFRTPEQLSEALRTSRARAFYSDVFFDRRITGAGKEIFSLADVAMGLQGAVDTLARLLARCERPFLRRYGPWLPAEET
jgi:hypothetical protein